MFFIGYEGIMASIFFIGLVMLILSMRFQNCILLHTAPILTTYHWY